MYKALHLPSGQEIIILDARWQQQVDYLRALDARDALVCPGCQQPVRVRAGQIKRWHFAHKHLQNCPFERESPALLNARAVLYAWLSAKFPSKAVTLEKIPEAAKLPRALDGWVEMEELRVGYWIFERHMPPNERDQLQISVQKISAPIQWIFLSDLLREDADATSNRLHLTTTERAFIQPSEFDQAWQTHFEQLGGSLHYLEADEETLITYRNLNVVHLPQLYAGSRVANPIWQVSAAPITGEFTHPGESERLQKRRTEIAAQEDIAAQRLQKAQDFFRRGSSSKLAAPPSKHQPGSLAFERRGICKICGKETADWITYFGKTNECICRDCKGRMQDGD